MFLIRHALPEAGTHTLWTFQAHPTSVGKPIQLLREYVHGTESSKVRRSKAGRGWGLWGIPTTGPNDWSKHHLKHMHDFHSVEMILENVYFLAPPTCQEAELIGPSAAALSSDRPVSGRLHRAVCGSDCFQWLWILPGKTHPLLIHLAQAEKLHW